MSSCWPEPAGGRTSRTNSFNRPDGNVEEALFDQIGQARRVIRVELGSIQIKLHIGSQRDEPVAAAEGISATGGSDHVDLRFASPPLAFGQDDVDISDSGCDLVQRRLAIHTAVGGYLVRGSDYRVIVAGLLVAPRILPG